MSVTCSMCGPLQEENQSDKEGCTPLIVATYFGNFAAVEILLSNELIDVSLMCKNRTAVQHATANSRVAAWSAFDEDINEEGRVKCQTLLKSHATANHK